MNQIDKPIYFGSLMAIEKIHFIRLWILINALKQDATTSDEYDSIGTITKSYLKSFLLEGGKLKEQQQHYQQ